MKTGINVAAWCLIISSVLSSCGGKKITSLSPDDVEINTPFSDVKSDKNYFRAVASGMSYDLNVAKKMAVNNAMSQIATGIQAVFNEVNTNYIQQYGQNSDMELGQKFEDMSRTVVSQVLSNLNEADSKTFRNSKTNAYTYWVVVEMSKSDAGKQLMKGVGEAAKNKIDFDLERYERIFNDELGKIQ
jgi:hypothetical protein